MLSPRVIVLNFIMNLKKKSSPETFFFWTLNLGPAAIAVYTGPVAPRKFFGPKFRAAATVKVRL